jgi:hypothetical protein
MKTSLFLKLFLTLLLTTLTPVSVFAQISILPSTSETQKNSKDLTSLIYSLNPGDSVSDTITIKNTQDSDLNILLASNDAQVTSEGVFTVAPNSQENKLLGAWIQIQEKNISVPAKQTREIPFTINIPKEVTTGEYGGAISMSILSNSASSAPVTIQNRIAQRIFVAVKGDLNLTTTVSGFEMLSPLSPDFEKQIQERLYFGPNNLVFSVTAENQGNLFSLLTLNYTLTLPDGTTTQRTESRELAPRSGEQKLYIQTNSPYRLGETTLQVNYSVKPIHFSIPDPDIKTGELEKSAEVKLVMKEEDLDKFQNSKQKATEALPKTENNGLTIPENKANTSNKTMLLLLLGISILAAAIAAGFYLQKRYGFVEKVKNALRRRSNK